MTEGNVAPHSSLQKCVDQLTRARATNIEAGAQLQAAVLLNGPLFDDAHIEYACTTLPSRMVDGDFLDVWRASTDTIDVLLGDVMGKGMEAATTGTAIKVAFLRALSDRLFGRRALPAVRDICSTAEATVASHIDTKRSIASLAYLRFDQRRALVEYVDFGHTEVVHYRKAEGVCRVLKGADMPWGFVRTQEPRTFFVPYRTGDVFVLFSDGLSECVGRDGSHFGIERIMHVTTVNAHRPPRELADELVRLGFDYSERGFSDDVSLVCLRVKEAAPAVCERTMTFRLGRDADSASALMRESLEEDLEPLTENDPILRGALLTACSEAFENAVHHGVQEKRGKCTASWRVVANAFTFEIGYRGTAYDWLRVPDNPIEAYGERGYGLTIIHQAMESVLMCEGFRDGRTMVLYRSLA